MKLKFDGSTIEITKNQGQYGIDGIREVSKMAFTFWFKLKKRSKNGFNFLELFYSALDAKSLTAEIIDDFKQIRKEVGELSQVELHALTAYVQKEFNIPQGDVILALQLIVFDTINFVIDGIELYNAINKVIKDLK